ncbi:MAG: 4Fe-4S dicluster domain-containing protein [Planctomycetota bacterium]
MVTESHGDHRSEFFNEVIADTPGGEQLTHCLQCGSCGGSCPNGADMEYTPRTLFAMINADRREEVLSANTMWCCVSCYFCTTRCPQQIPITDLMYSLKRKAIAAGFATETDAPALAKTFTGFVENYGRSFEFGLASRYYFFNRPLSMVKLVPMGLSMFARGRMHLKPKKIRQLDQLQAIIKKAREIGGPQ